MDRGVAHTGGVIFHAGYGLAELFLDNVPQLVGLGGVQLADGHDLGLGGQHGAELAQFAVKHHEVAGRVVGLTVDEMDVHPGTFGVAKELVTQPDTTVGTFQQPGNLHHHEVLPAVCNYAQHRLDGGERVIGNFGLRRGASRDEGGLAGIGLGQQAHVGQQLQLQPQYGVIAFLAGFRQHRLLVSGGYEPGIAPAAFAAFSDEHRLLSRNVGQEILAAILVKSPGNSTHGNRDLAVLAIGATLVLALAVTAALQVEGAVELQVQQRVDGVVAHEVSATAIATITTVRPATRLVFEPQEANAAVATIPSLDVNSNCINHGESRCLKFVAIVRAWTTLIGMCHTLGDFVGNLEW